MKPFMGRLRGTKKSCKLSDVLWAAVLWTAVLFAPVLWAAALTDSSRT